MSFETLKKAELLQAAADFGVELGEKPTNAEIIAALVEDGVSWETYQEFYLGNTEVDLEPKPEEKISQDDDEEMVLIRMTRSNPTFEAWGYKFSKTHPYALVKESDADALIEKVGGFRVASPSEAREFYS